VLKLPDFERPFEVHTDASDRAIGGVLVQKGHPVAFESRKLNEAEQRYSTHEKEMTAVVHCLGVWRVYLLGPKFVVKTDNVANTFFKTQKKLSQRQARWQEFLAEYDFEWEHKPGRHNQVADALSRRCVLATVFSLVQVESDMLERLHQAAEEDAAYKKMADLVREGTVRRYWLENDLLYAKGGRVYVPKGKLRRLLMSETHDPQWAGHPGRERMIALLSQTYYWPKIDEDVELYVRTCLIFQQDKTVRQREAGLLQPLPIADKLWVSVSMDFIVGFPKVDDMNAVMVVVDRFSKYAVFIAAPSVCTAEVAARMFYRNVVKYFGVPTDIVSDRDARFTGRFWTALFNMMGTQLKFSTANHPQTDGQTERINALLEEYLRHYVTATQRNWVELLDSA
jgi:ribonucleotide monophosphatase NagD (HAD superfamily)